MTPQNHSILRASNIYFGLALIALAAAVAYGVFRFNILQQEKLAVETNAKQRASIETAVSKEKKSFDALAEARGKKQEELARKISAIIPAGESYTTFTRLLDEYFEEHDTAGNPIVQSSLRFGTGTPVPDAPGFFILPISMNIESTRDNFFKFLEFVNSSGSIDLGTRLMDIESIQLNFTEGGESLMDPRQKINFTVDMNAYYQAPKIAR